MKRLFVILFILAIPVFAQGPGLPNKNFDVRNGNGVVDNGTTYPAAIVIPFKNTAALNKFLDDYAENNNYEGLVANPLPTKRQFALDGIRQWMKDQSVAGRDRASQKAITKPDTSDLP